MLAHVSETNSVFRVGARRTAIVAARKRRAPIGTTFRFSLNEAAVVTITVKRSTVGRRSGKVCVKPTRKLAHKHRCTRIVTLGKLIRHARPGANRVAFTGRIGRRALPPGTYTATFGATADGKTGVNRVLRFVIVR